MCLYSCLFLNLMLFPKKGSVTGSLGIRKAEAGGGAPAFRGGTRGDCLGGGVCVNVTFLPHKCWKFKKKTKKKKQAS